MSKKMIFVIGPSGIGKTSIINKFMVSAGNRFKYISMDDVTAEESYNESIIEKKSAYFALNQMGNNAFFLFGIMHLGKKIDCMDNVYIIDVGAAFQNVSLLSSLLGIYNTVLITAKKEICYNRYCEYRKDDRNFDRHIEIEFSTVRSNLYASAKNFIDTSDLDLIKSADNFGTVVRKIFPS